MLCEDRSEYDWIVVPTKQKKSLGRGGVGFLFLGFGFPVLPRTAWLGWDECRHLFGPLVFHFMLVHKLLIFILFDFVLVEHQVDYLL